MAEAYEKAQELQARENKVNQAINEANTRLSEAAAVIEARVKEKRATLEKIQEELAGALVSQSVSQSAAMERKPSWYYNLLIPPGLHLSPPVCVSTAVNEAASKQEEMVKADEKAEKLRQDLEAQNALKAEIDAAQAELDAMEVSQVNQLDIGSISAERESLISCFWFLMYTYIGKGQGGS